MALIVEYDCYLPKHHMLYHLIDSLVAFGNPSWYSNWLDESLNRLLKSSCRYASQQTFEASVLLAMKDLLGGAGHPTAPAAKRPRASRP